MRARRPTRRLACLALFLTVILQSIAATRTAVANGLAADVSDRLIAITTAFSGDQVVVFGSVESDGPVVVTVQGPRQDQMVRRKSRVAGIWINRDRIEFKNVPSFFAIASSGVIDDIADPALRHRLELGVDYLRFDPVEGYGLSSEELSTFTAALIRNKEREGLYTVEPVKIVFPGPKLFRATFDFPANVPPGLYRIGVFQLRDGQVTGAQHSSLQINKVGMEAAVYDFAREKAPLYGLVSILIAIAAGWLAGVIFRKA